MGFFWVAILGILYSEEDEFELKFVNLSVIMWGYLEWIILSVLYHLALFFKKVSMGSGSRTKEAELIKMIKSQLISIAILIMLFLFAESSKQSPTIQKEKKSLNFNLTSPNQRIKFIIIKKLFIHQTCGFKIHQKKKNQQSIVIIMKRNAKYRN